MLSASANKLSKLKEQAEGYAALIMEELDPENLGYIEVRVVKERRQMRIIKYLNKYIKRKNLFVQFIFGPLLGVDT